jgi:2-methylisocitrate lyase-like PEP mutase family enzyme
MTSPAAKLRQILARPGIRIMPGCHDAMSARLIEEAGFEMGFMSGFAVSADRLALPDTGLLSYGELADQGRAICAAVSIPMFGDGDTGFGNALNVKRTVEGYARAGFACIMLEDQVAPKRCGHTQGKAVVVLISVQN